MLALAQNALVMGSFIIKSRAPVDRINAGFHQVLRARYPYLPAGQVATVSSVIDSSVAQTRYNMALLTGLAALAMVLSAVGIYGVMAYVVSQQRRAMAIRLALGASPRHVQSLSIRQGLTPILVGIAGGLAGAWFLTTLVKKELFHVRPHDPLPMAIAAVGLFIVGVAACWIPSRRTARINPVTVLKAD